MVFLTVASLTKSNRSLLKMVLFQGRLLDFLASRFNPEVLHDYLVIKEAGPDTDMAKITFDLSAKRHARLMDGLKQKIAMETDPDEKRKLSEMLKEMNGVFTIMSTLDPESSPDYVSKVAADVEAAMRRIMELRENG